MSILDQPMSKFFPALPRGDSVRARMRDLGWCLSVDDDTMVVGWLKVNGCGIVIAYSDADRAEFERDLARCQAAYEAAV